LDFRRLEKDRLQALIPGELMDEVRMRASKERKSVSEMITQILCEGLKIDSRTYGIEPGRRGRQVAAST